MERQKREHQESLAQAAEKHSRKLKDLGKISLSATARKDKVEVLTNRLRASLSPAETSCSQKLAVEHEKYQELKQRHESMQEDFKRQLKVSEESSCQTVAQLTQLYDAQLEEKAKVLAQVRGHARRVVQSISNSLELQTKNTSMYNGQCGQKGTSQRGRPNCTSNVKSRAVSLMH